MIDYRRPIERLREYEASLTSERRAIFRGIYDSLRMKLQIDEALTLARKVMEEDR